MVKITRVVRNGTFLYDPQVVATIRQNGSTLHLFGVASDACVHGQLEHLYGCLVTRRHVIVDRTLPTEQGIDYAPPGSPTGT